MGNILIEYKIWQYQITIVIALIACFIYTFPFLISLIIALKEDISNFFKKRGR